MMRIYLVRHGHTNAGSAYDTHHGYPDPALSEVGIRQAEKLGERLLHQKIAAIYSSDLKRASETAEIIARYANAEVILKPQLREINMGEIFKQGWEAFPGFHDEWLKHEADLPYPGGEAGMDVKKRACLGLGWKNVSCLHPQQIVVSVCCFTIR